MTPRSQFLRTCNERVSFTRCSTISPVLVVLLRSVYLAASAGLESAQFHTGKLAAGMQCSMYVASPGGAARRRQ
jgi:hypothetical protein